MADMRQLRLRLIKVQLLQSDIIKATIAIGSWLPFNIFFGSQGIDILE